MSAGYKIALTFFNKFITFHEDWPWFIWEGEKEQMKSGYWLLIIIRSLGKVRTLRVERRPLIILGLGGIFFAGSLAFFAHEYFTFLQERSDLMSKMQQLTHRIAAMEKNLPKAVMEKASPRATLPLLTMAGLKVSRRGKRGGFSVSFQLINQNPQNHPVSGTLALVAQNDRQRIPLYRVIPEMPLNKGVPQQPEKGKKFEIERQKFIEAFFDGSSGEVFKTLTIFVYLPDGKLILEKSTAIPER